MGTIAVDDCSVFMDDVPEDFRISRGHIEWCAKAMGAMLAGMHWLGCLDGRGFEFALAPANVDHPSEFETDFGKLILWMLDFEQIGRINPLGLNGMEEAATVFYEEIPSCPDPDTSPYLWSQFKGRNTERVRGLAGRDFIERVGKKSNRTGCLLLNPPKPAGTY
ncbi:hypothetical protein ETB97_002770 [Aspergillus alliaceus]|uniref:DUF3669 domain-containing protein n=1 Tax=Petromyces alliaceus TaxID=209559 RepID=A0A8H6E4X3_PETAA|nr:hypothetical protein ETB97_002770 [Aspergillus burnettii]